MSLDLIKQKLERADLSAWQIRTTRKKSYQSFLAKQDRECQRFAESESHLVTIHKRSGENLGISQFKVTPGNLAQFDSLFRDALFAAQLVKNEPFELATNPSLLPRVKINDKTLSQKTLGELETRLKRSISKEKKIRLSSAEFFIDKIETQLCNHLGLNVKQEESIIETEFILLARTSKGEKEFISRYQRRYLEDFEIEKEVRTSAQLAREATMAQLPQTGQFPVVFTDEPLDRMFTPILARASARLKYNKMLETTPGQNVLSQEKEAQGDKLTLWSNGLMNGGLGSSQFDSYGTPSQRVCLVENNTLKNYIADKRYSQYLNLPLTGEMGNVELEGGSKNLKDLLDPSYWKEKTIYHILAFSAFEPNAITGAFSAEIRSGYEITSKGKKPIKGGSVSGVLQQDLLDTYFSKEREQRENALVPKGVFFRSLTLAGRS